MIDLSHHFCSDLKCEDHCVTGKLNITTSMRYDKNNTYLLLCKIFYQMFYENRNTIIMHSNYKQNNRE